MKTEDTLFHQEFEDRQRAVGPPPPLLLRFGNSVVLVLVLTLVSVAALVKSPDKISVRAIVTTTKPPIRLNAKVDGMITRLLVKNNSRVKQGDLLAVIENSAHFADALFLDSLMKTPFWEEQLTALTRVLEIGILQTTFSDLVVKQNDLKVFEKGSFFNEKLNSIKFQVQQLKNLNETLIKKRNFIAQQRDLANNDYLRNKKLLEEGVISNVDFEKIQISFLNFSNQLETTNADILSNQIQETQLVNEMSELTVDHSEQMRSRRISRDEAKKNMESEIANWTQLYLINSPVTGTISLTGIQNEKQFVRANAEVLTVIPDDGASQIVAKSSLKGLGSGKVANGMKVIIHLDGFPYQEFGSLIGAVSSVASVPGQDGYIVEIKLPETLTTTYKRRINFTQEMQGDAIVITDNKSLLERIFEKFLSAAKNSE